MTAHLDLPHDLPSLASALSLTPETLHHLTHTPTASLYTSFQIPKKSGGARTLHAPIPLLRDAQSAVATALLSRFPLHDAAHGFVPGRSTVSNAAPHREARLLITLDLEDFFPSIGAKRVKKCLIALGFSPQLAHLLTRLCTASFAPEQGAALPQGAPSSPALSNLVCRRLDGRLAALARSLGYTYTRYADDLTFSTPTEAGVLAQGRLVRQARRIIADERFRLQPSKTHIRRPSQRQEVTGLIVNSEVVHAPRELRHQLRAMLHTLERDGLLAAHFGARHGEEALRSIEGMLSYFKMIDEAQAAPLLARFDRLRGVTREASPG